MTVPLTLIKKMLALVSNWLFHHYTKMAYWHPLLPTAPCEDKALQNKEEEDTADRTISVKVSLVITVYICCLLLKVLDFLFSYKCEQLQEQQ